MIGDKDLLRLPEHWRNSKKKHDPDKLISYHECGHSLIQVCFGLIPTVTSLIPYPGVNGYSSAGFYACYDIGVNWSEEGRDYAVMHPLGGVVAGAAYSGWYNWHGAGEDLKGVVNEADHYGMDFDDILRLWIRAHELIEMHYEVLERAAQKLFQDKVLDDQYWETVLLTPAKNFTIF